jgi:hypothetical protein
MNTKFMSQADMFAEVIAEVGMDATPTVIQRLISVRFGTTMPIRLIYAYKGRMKSNINIGKVRPVPAPGPGDGDDAPLVSTRDMVAIRALYDELGRERFGALCRGFGRLLDHLDAEGVLQAACAMGLAVDCKDATRPDPPPAAESVASPEPEPAPLPPPVNTRTRPRVTLSRAMLAVIGNIGRGEPPCGHAKDPAQMGGLTNSMMALIRRGYVTENGQLTDTGRRVYENTKGTP